jgi:hypothetical protein
LLLSAGSPLRKIADATGLTGGLCRSLHQDIPDRYPSLPQADALLHPIGGAARRLAAAFPRRDAARMEYITWR